MRPPHCERERERYRKRKRRERKAKNHDTDVNLQEARLLDDPAERPLSSQLGRITALSNVSAAVQTTTTTAEMATGGVSSISEDRGAIHQLLSIILKLRILVLLPVSNLHYVLKVKNYSLIGE
jgi:hypothetical protein